MPKAPNNLTPKKNATEERLRATPFSGVEALDLEENAIRLSVWRRFTESKVIEELLSKPDFKHILEELRAGLSCSMNLNVKDSLYKIFSEGRGLKLEINRSMVESLGEHQVKFFQGVVQAGIEGYGAIYMQTKGVILRPSMDMKEADSAGLKKHKA